MENFEAQKLPKTGYINSKLNKPCYEELIWFGNPKILSNTRQILRDGYLEILPIVLKLECKY